MSTKKQLRNRWLEEPGRSVADRIGQMLLDYAEITRRLEWEACEATGLYSVPPGLLPPFDTRSIFDLLSEIPFREEIENGRDLRGVPSIGGGDGWDFSETNFSFLPNDEGYVFINSNLNGAVFDGSKGEFDFRRCSLDGARFRNVRFVHRIWFNGDRMSCDFTHAVLPQAAFRGIGNGSWDPRESVGMDLRGSIFAGAKLKNADLTRCDLRECSFHGANLTGASIHEAIIDKTTDFRGTNFTNLWWQERRDNQGKLFLRATDWRMGTYDSTTIHD